MLGIFFYILAVLICWGLLAVFTIKKYFDAPFFFLSMSAFFILVPALHHAFFEPQIPIYMMVDDINSLYLKQALIIALFAAGLLIGYMLIKTTGGGERIFPNYNYQKLQNLEVLGLAVLFLGGISSFLPFLSGSLFSTIDALRHGDALEGFSFLRQFSTIGSYLGGACLLNIMIIEKEKAVRLKQLKIFVLILFIGMLFVTSLFGGKSGVVYPLFIFFLGYSLCVKRKPIRAMLAPILILIALIIGLQTIRMTFIQHTSEQFAPNAAIESALVTNLVSSNLKYLEIVDNGVLEQKTGEDFINGIVGIIPRVLWPNKPEAISVGGKFRRAVHPDGRGGRPVLGYNQWYSNFGWFGVVFGGILTGCILRILQKRYQDLDKNPYSLVLSALFTIILLLKAGIDNSFVISYILYVVPIFIFKVLTSRGFYPKSMLRYR